MCARCHVISVVEWDLAHQDETDCVACHGESDGHVIDERTDLKLKKIPHAAAIAGLVAMPRGGLRQDEEHGRLPDLPSRSRSCRSRSRRRRTSGWRKGRSSGGRDRRSCPMEIGWQGLVNGRPPPRLTVRPTL